MLGRGMPRKWRLTIGYVYGGCGRRLDHAMSGGVRRRREAAATCSRFLRDRLPCGRRIQIVFAWQGGFAMRGIQYESDLSRSLPRSRSLVPLRLSPLPRSPARTLLLQPPLSHAAPQNIVLCSTSPTSPDGTDPLRVFSWIPSLTCLTSSTGASPPCRLQAKAPPRPSPASALKGVALPVSLARRAGSDGERFPGCSQRELY